MLGLRISLQSSSKGSILFRPRHFSSSHALQQSNTGYRGGTLGYSTPSHSAPSQLFTPNEELVGDGGAWDDGVAGYEWKKRLLSERRGMALDYLTDVRKRVPIHNAVRIRARLNRERLLNDINGGAGAQAGGGADSLAGNYNRVLRKNAGAYDVDGIHDDVSDEKERLSLELNLNSPSAVLTEALRASHYNPALDTDAPLESDTAARLALAAERDPISHELISSSPLSSSSSSTSTVGRKRVMDAIDLVEEELEDLVADESVLECLANIPPEDLKELRHEFFGGAPEVSSSHGDSTDETLRQWLRLRKDSSLYHSYMSVPADERKEWSAFYLRDIHSSKEVE